MTCYRLELDGLGRNVLIDRHYIRISVRNLLSTYVEIVQLLERKPGLVYALHVEALEGDTLLRRN